MYEIETDLAAIRVVEGADELADLTSRGWRLIFIAQETRPDSWTISERCKGGNAHGSCEHGYSGSGCGYTVEKTSLVSRTVTRFVVGRDEDSALADLREEMKIVRESECASRHEAVSRKHELDDLRKELETRADALEKAIGDARKSRERYSQAQDQIYKLETAISEERNKNQKLTKALADKVTG